MSRTVGQRGGEGRLGKIVAAKRLPGAAEEVGGGTHFFLDRPEQEDEQGLRKANRDERGVYLRSDESPNGEAVGPLMRLFGRFLSEAR